MGENKDLNLSLSDYEYLKSLLDRVEKLEEALHKFEDERFSGLRESIELHNTIETLSKAIIESRAERKELRDELNNMNSVIRTTLNDSLNKMIDFSNDQNAENRDNSNKDKEFLRKLIMVFATALVTVVLAVLGIKTLIPVF